MIAKDVHTLAAVFGDYVVQCFHSKVWSLRDAALQKVRIDIERNAYPQPRLEVFIACSRLLQVRLPSFARALPAPPSSHPLPAAQVAATDKIAQVFGSAADLLIALLRSPPTQELRRAGQDAEVPLVGHQLRRYLRAHRCGVRGEAV